MPKPKKSQKDFVFHVQANEIQKEWKFSKPKDSGAVGAGEYGGFYSSTFKDKNGIDQKQSALIKQDKRIELNIAEFLAGRVYQELLPNTSAVIHLAKVEGGKIPSEDGKDVYLISEFIPGTKSILYDDIQKTLLRIKLKENNDKLPEGERLTDKQIEAKIESDYQGLSKIMAVESAQLFNLLMRTGDLAKAFEAENKQGNNLNFGEVMITSLLVNNIDSHLANLMVLEENGVKKLGTIDYGVAFRNMTDKINPHSILKYLPTHAVRTEAMNNFVFYPEVLKIQPAFVQELDRVAATGLDQTYKEAFEEISRNYGSEPIEKFALRTGLVNENQIKAIKTLYKNDDEDIYKNKLVGYLEDKMNKNMQARQEDLSRFSAQIKASLCLQKNGKNWEFGAYKTPQGVEVNFADVVLQHHTYFAEVITGKEKFKFRKSEHKRNAHLVDEVVNRAGFELADVLMRDKELCKRYMIVNRDQAYELIKSNALPASQLFQTIEKAINLPRVSTPQPSLFLTMLELDSGYKKIDKMSITDAQKVKAKEVLNVKFSVDLNTALESGSNPNFKLPDGSKVINLAHDLETMKLLVEFGAKLNNQALKKDFLDSHDKKELRKLESKFVHDCKYHETKIHFKCEDYIKSGDIDKLSGAIHRLQMIDPSLKIRTIVKDSEVENRDLLAVAAAANRPEVVKYLMNTNLKFDLNKALLASVDAVPSNTSSKDDTVAIASMLIKAGAFEKIKYEKEKNYSHTAKHIGTEINNMIDNHIILENKLMNHIKKDFSLHSLNSENGKELFCESVGKLVDNLVNNEQRKAFDGKARDLFDKLKDIKNANDQLPPLKKFVNSIREILGVDDFSKLLDKEAKSMKKEALGMQR